MGIDLECPRPATTVVRIGRRTSYLVRRRTPADPGAPGYNAGKTRALDRADPTGLAARDSGVDDSWLEAQCRFGGLRTTLLDMQGIESFMFGRAKLFDDRHAVHIAHELLPLESGVLYLRVGASGAPPVPGHPGGEVLEDAYVRDGRTVGVPRSLSGHLPDGSVTTDAARLEIDGEVSFRRSIYSHTALLPERHDALESFLLTAADTPAHPVDLLSWIASTARSAGLEAFSVRLRVTPAAGGRAPVVVGRALRRLPHGPLRGVAEATAIASEVAFALQPGQSLVAYGTHRPRHEPLWEQWRDGKAYEPAGHLHFRLEPPGADQHAVAHLRSLTVAPSTPFAAVIDPVAAALRVDPVRREDGWVVSAASGRRLVRVVDVDEVRAVEAVTGEAGEVM